MLICSCILQERISCREVRTSRLLFFVTSSLHTVIELSRSNLKTPEIIPSLIGNQCTSSSALTMSVLEKLITAVGLRLYQPTHSLHVHLSFCKYIPSPFDTRLSLYSKFIFFLSLFFSCSFPTWQWLFLWDPLIHPYLMSCRMFMVWECTYTTLETSRTQSVSMWWLLLAMLKTVYHSRNGIDYDISPGACEFHWTHWWGQH